MKRWLPVYFFICCTIPVFAQDHFEFSSVDRAALSIPPAETYTTEQIAKYVVENFKTDKEKFRAIYTWVTANIKYNTDSMYSINWGADAEAKIVTALRRRKGVCENYAAIFNDIANKAALRSFVVTGYTRQGATVVRTGHCWCAVYLDGEWLLCDPTWDEGFRGNARYFLILPDQFIETHLPFDPLWQLLPHPISPREFARGNFYFAKKNIAPVNFKDSVNAFLQMNELQQQEASARRMQVAGIENDMQKNWFSYVKMKIAIVYGENDMELYNSAVADLNRATSIFNEFVQYRNNHFTPSRPEAEINAMLDPIAVAILAAWEKINHIGKTVENFQYNTSGLSDRLVRLTARVQEQKNFLKEYFSGSVAEKEKLL